MLDQLKAKIGQKLDLELLSGKIISGTLLELNDQYLRLRTSEGIGTIAVSSVQIIWETQKRTLTEEDMKEISEKLKEGAKAQHICTSAQFVCPTQYVCLPPHVCTGTFFCPPGRFIDTSGTPVPCVTQFYGFVGPGQQPGAAPQPSPPAAPPPGVAPGMPGMPIQQPGMGYPYPYQPPVGYSVKDKETKE